MELGKEGKEASEGGEGQGGGEYWNTGRLYVWDLPNQGEREEQVSRTAVEDEEAYDIGRAGARTEPQDMRMAELALDKLGEGWPSQAAYGWAKEIVEVADGEALP